MWIFPMFSHEEAGSGLWGEDPKGRLPPFTHTRGTAAFVLPTDFQSCLLALL